MKLFFYVAAFLKSGLSGLLNELGGTLKDEFSERTHRAFAVSILAYFPAEAAVPQMLKRLELTTSNGMHDKQEKAEICRLIEGEGEVIVPLVIEHCQTAMHLSWPILLLERFQAGQELGGTLIGLLADRYPEFDERVRVRNREVLVALNALGEAAGDFDLEPHLRCRYPEIQAIAKECAQRRTLLIANELSYVPLNVAVGGASS